MQQKDCTHAAFKKSQESLDNATYNYLLVVRMLRVALSFAVALCISFVLAKIILQGHSPATEYVGHYNKSYAPYHLAIRYLDNFLCDSFLYLSPTGNQVVLTAASCLTGFYLNQDHPSTQHFSVFSSEVDSTGNTLGQQYSSVKAIYIHPKWKQTSAGFENNIAAVFLSNNLKVNEYVQPLEIQNEPYANPEKLWISSWRKSAVISGLARKVNGGICNASNDSSFCTISCAHGDNGGLALFEANGTNYAAGLKSWTKKHYGKQCGFDVFTSLNPYLKWIQMLMDAQWFFKSNTTFENTKLQNLTLSDEQYKHRLKRSELKSAFEHDRFKRQADIEISPRVHGGSVAKPGQVPWHLELNFNGSYKCGAGLILSPLGHHFAVTTALCVRKDKKLLDLNLFEIRAGVLKRSVELCFTQSRNIELIALTDDPDKIDLAILFLDRQFYVDKFVKPLPLANNKNLIPGYEELITTAGWGSTKNTDESIRSDDLNVKSVIFVTFNDCFTAFFPNYGGNAIHEFNICTWDKPSGGTQGVCYGDNGGVGAGTKDPDTGKPYAAGVYSWGTCSTAGTPSVYVRLSYFKNWIEETDANHVKGRPPVKADFTPENVDFRDI